jgi:hypothetical protein
MTNSELKVSRHLLSVAAMCMASLWRVNSFKTTLISDGEFKKKFLGARWNKKTHRLDDQLPAVV